MKASDKIMSKIFTREQLIKRIAQWRVLDKKIAFTNGCFDILHKGHIYSLSEAAKEADYLIVGLNSDHSVTKLKGKGRPINESDARAAILSALIMVDAVVIFDEDTPLDLIKAIQPDVLVKGGDYTIDQIAGAKEMIARGGKVVINPSLKGYSTSAIITKSNAR